MRAQCVALQGFFEGDAAVAEAVLEALDYSNEAEACWACDLVDNWQPQSESAQHLVLRKLSVEGDVVLALARFQICNGQVPNEQALFRCMLTRLLSLPGHLLADHLLEHACSILQCQSYYVTQTHDHRACLLAGAAADKLLSAGSLPWRTYKNA